MIGLGMLFGFGAEIYWKGNFLWMSGGGFAGGLAGLVCDTGVYFYRRYEQTRKSSAQFGSSVPKSSSLIREKRGKSC